MFRGTDNIPHNIVMDLNNVMGGGGKNAYKISRRVPHHQNLILDDAINPWKAKRSSLISHLHYWLI